MAVESPLRFRSRRTATLSVAGVLAVALSAASALLPVPYAMLSPGTPTNTLGGEGESALIRVEGRRTYPTQGALDFTVVEVSGGPEDGLDLLSALWGWLDPQTAVVPRESVYPAGQTAEQVQQRNAEDMALSQQDATTAALRELEVPAEKVLVKSVLAEAPALGKLRAGDQILSVDGKPVRAGEDVRTAVSAHRPGEEVVLRVRRAGAEREVRVTAGETVDAAGTTRAVIGIVPAETYPFEVKIALNERVGGPSAGLMFALGIVDKLTPGALNGGAHVAGTGTIDPDGQVGAIGGIQQKLVGARDAGATVFLAPAANCPQAQGAVPDGLRLVKVATLSEARAALEALAAGRDDVPTC